MSSPRPFTLLVACAALALGGLAAVNSSELARTAENPGIQLPTPLRGAAAIQALGPRLSDVAILNHRTPQSLAQALARDSDLWIDTGGRPLYLCQPPKPDLLARSRRQQAIAAETQAEAPPFPVASTFQLHSRPTSTRKIYLDFDGYVTPAGTLWNSGNTITSTPFDLDGVPGTWSTAEYEAIQHVWQRMTEDYAGFNVDITTEDPGVEALRRTNVNDVAYGVRVVFSPTEAWSNPDGTKPVGGLAYVGSFTWNTDTPCFVFTANVSNNEKFMADAGSHEAGHTLGLNHDGTATLPYYSGQGSWGPIMGAPYGFALSQWSNGDYTGANNQEDDIAIMGTFGVNLVDDFGSTVANPSNVVGPTVQVDGVISSRTDVDVFRFLTGTGPITITATPYTFGPNLDIQIELISANGVLVATSNPATLDASIKQSVPAGAYYVRVDGVGAGDRLTTGYSDYGSLGYYQLNMTLTAAVAPEGPNNLVATATSPAEIALTWTDFALTEDAFELERKIGAGTFSRISSLAPNTIGYTDRDVESGETYTYRVRATNAGGVSPYSNEASATVPYAPPGAPALLLVASARASEIDIAWHSGTGQFTSYELQEQEGIGTFIPIAQFDASVTSTRRTGQLPNTKYAYRIRAVGLGGTSDWSNTLSATLPPTAPTNLAVTAINGGFRVEWMYFGNATYKLERKLGQGQFVEIAQRTDATTSYTDLGFLWNVTASYRVRASTQSGDSVYSNVATATTAAPGLKSLTFQKAKVQGRKPLKATIDLEGPAPGGGTLVNLTVYSASVQPPAGIRVPAGATSITFDIATKKVRRNETVLVTASYGASSRTAQAVLKK